MYKTIITEPAELDIVEATRYIVRDDIKSVTIERFLHSTRDWMHIIGQSGR